MVAVDEGFTLGFFISGLSRCNTSLPLFVSVIPAPSFVSVIPVETGIQAIDGSLLPF